MRNINFNVHEKIAACWLALWAAIGQAFVAIATAPNASLKLWCFSAGVAFLIVTVPVLLRWQPLRATFCWTDVWTDDERRFLKAGQLKAYWQEAHKSNFVGRVFPYGKRLLLPLVALQVTPELLHQPGEITKFVFLTANTYGLGVLLAFLISLPLPHLRLPGVAR